MEHPQAPDERAIYGLDSDQLEAARAAGTLPNLQLLKDGSQLKESPAVGALRLIRELDEKHQGDEDKIVADPLYDALGVLLHWPFSSQDVDGTDNDPLTCIMLVSHMTGYHPTQVCDSFAQNERMGTSSWNSEANRYEVPAPVRERLAGLDEQEMLAEVARVFAEARQRDTVDGGGEGHG